MRDVLGRLDKVTPTQGNDVACSGAGLGPCESGRNYKSPGCEGRGGVCGAVHHVYRRSRSLVNSPGVRRGSGARPD